MSTLPSRVIGTIGALVAAAAFGIAAPASASAADATSWCDAYLEGNAPPSGWTAECADDLPGWPENVAGYADRTNKHVVIRRGADANVTRHTMGHEYYHALDAETLTDEARARFAERLGKTVWRDDADYRHSPNEVWADGMARCNGWHDDDWGYTQVPCEWLTGSATSEARAETEPMHEVGEEQASQVEWEQQAEPGSGGEQEQPDLGEQHEQGQSDAGDAGDEGSAESLSQDG